MTDQEIRELLEEAEGWSVVISGSRARHLWKAKWLLSELSEAVEFLLAKGERNG